MNSDSHMLEYTHKELMSINASLGSKIQQQAEQITDLNYTVDKLQGWNRYHRAEIKRLKELLKDTVRYCREYNHEEPVQLCRDVDEALAAQPQKGE